MAPFIQSLAVDRPPLIKLDIWLSVTIANQLELIVELNWPLSNRLGVWIIIRIDLTGPYLSVVGNECIVGLFIDMCAMVINSGPINSVLIETNSGRNVIN